MPLKLVSMDVVADLPRMKTAQQMKRFGIKSFVFVSYCLCSKRNTLATRSCSYFLMEPLQLCFHA
jgi:uncharacterized protein (DUF362 family)